jgi:dihydrofolate reductase
VIVSVIVAAAENGVIGRAGALPWHLSEDLKRFKRLTTGHPVVMGRKTWESIGRALPGRRNLVVSRTPGYAAAGADVFGSLDEALAACAGEDEIFVIGGAMLYAEALSRADRLYLTRVHATVEGDVTFPEIDPAGWTLVSEERHEADARHEHAFSFLVYERAGRDRPD